MYEAKLFAEEENLQIAQIASTDNGPLGKDKRLYSSMTKLLRVAALVCRFINRLKRGKASNGPVQTFEIEQVEELWTAHIRRLHYSTVLSSVQANTPNNARCLS